ncbi:MAG: transketolase [Chloroflexota bacterium]|nr:MAG: transketolase [Chloroflexota bacterium]
MRTAFINTLFELARGDTRITLVVGDLGFGVVTRFMERLPLQFVNAGVAEQNMTSMAAGMALSGKIVLTYSIANFPVMRCLEQIRNDVCYHRANVKIVAVGGGLSYGALGPSHHATEDIAVMRALPNMIVVAPGDPIEAALATRAIVTHQGPCYLRLGRDQEPVVHPSLDVDFRLGKAIAVREGSDLTLIATGALLPTVVAVSDRLGEHGISARVLSMHTVKPLDTDAVVKAGHETGTIFTVEEHSIVGGLGSAVAEVLLEAGIGQINFRRIGLRDGFSSQVGDQDYLRAHYDLDADGILRTIDSALARANASIL